MKTAEEGRVLDLKNYNRREVLGRKGRKQKCGNNEQSESTAE